MPALRVGAVNKVWAKSMASDSARAGASTSDGVESRPGNKAEGQMLSAGPGAGGERIGEVEAELGARLGLDVQQRGRPGGESRSSERTHLRGLFW